VEEGKQVNGILGQNRQRNGRSVVRGDPLNRPSTTRLDLVEIPFIEQPPETSCQSPLAAEDTLQPGQQPASLDVRLAKIEYLLARLVEQRTVKEWYTPAEAAKLLGKAEFTVREWCRNGRVHARKREGGRGRSQEWVISHDELERIRNEGLLVQPRVSTRIG
jgi:DNA-directed RNA polymerase specialized sigma24 family protein